VVFEFADRIYIDNLIGKSEFETSLRSLLKLKRHMHASHFLRKQILEAGNLNKCAYIDAHCCLEETCVM